MWLFQCTLEDYSEEGGRDRVRRAARSPDPTRHRLFRYIVDAARPVGVGELTDYVQLNHNAVRQHLAVLKDAGLVTEEVEDRDRAGRQDGHRRAAEIAGTRDRVDLLEAEMTRRGFRPTRVERGRRVDFVLGRCPFAEVAASDPGTVCQLHLGMAEGLTEGLGGLAVENLVPKDPRRAGCRLTVRRATTGTGAPT